MSSEPRFQIVPLASEQQTAFARARYWPSLDGLRALSIVAVVWHHAAGPRTGLLGQGYRGVDLFFAISGFLITSLLLRERERTGTIDLPGFYIRRSLRIFPLYYLVLGVYAALVLVMESGSVAGREFMHNLPFFATYTSNWVVDLRSERVIFYFAWSLATEEQFYASWPSVVRFTRRWWTPIAFMGVLVLAWGSAQVATRMAWLDAGQFGVRMLLAVSPAICFGSIAAIVVHRPRGFRVTAYALGARWSAPVLLAAVIVGLAVPFTPEIVLHALMTVLVVACCIRPDHALRPLLENRVARHIGVVSYGMYLVHMIAMNVVRRVVHVRYGVVVFALALVLTIALATLSHRYFEQWFLDLKDRLSHRRAEARTATPAQSA